MRNERPKSSRTAILLCGPTLAASAFLASAGHGQYSPPSATHDLLYTIWGSPGFPLSTFGNSRVTADDDLDGDGRGDVVVNSLDVNSGSGAVRTISGADGSTLWEYYGENQGTGPVVGEELGEDVDLVDWDGDGLKDVAAGAQNYCAAPCPTIPTETGRIRILRGVDGQLLTTLYPSPSLAAAGAGGTLYAYGLRLSAGADLTGDGIHDLVTTAFWGPASLGFVPGTAFVIEVPSGQVASYVVGTMPGEWFGSEVQPPSGDVLALSALNGIGHLVVGSPRTYTATATGLGSVRLFDLSSPVPVFEEIGSLPNEHLGVYLSRGPDLDLDGVADFAVSRWPGKILAWPWSQPWSVDVRSGASGQLLYTFGSTVYPLGNMSHSGMSFVPDMSGDGVPDIVSNALTGGVSRIQVHSGSDGSQMYVWIYPQSAGFVSSVRAYSLGDVNADGWGDVGIVHPLAPNSAGEPVGKLEAYARRSLKAFSPPTLGGSLVLQVLTPRLPGKPYFLLFSGSTAPPLTVGPFVIPLAADALFWASLGFGLLGVLDPSAAATLTIPIPYDPSLSGTTVHASGVVVDAASPYGIGTVLTKLTLTVP